MKKIRMFSLMAAPLALVALLAGCASGDSSMPGMDHDGSPSSSPSVEVDFNDADAVFASMMIPHHQQAVEMSEMILGKAGVDQRVLDLAEQIKDAQGPEIELMQSWLDTWGVPSSDGMDGMDHGDGMMSDDDIAALDAANGIEASQLFLEQMILHHSGAIEMAQSELADGINPDALDLAKAIVDAQTTEMAAMQDLLRQI